MTWVNRTLPRLSATLALLSCVSILLLIGGAVKGVTDGYSYMLWNLFLGWLPLVFIFWLLHRLPRKRWSSWEGIITSVLWLGFLPNSFYLISDLIHLQESSATETTYTAVMLMSFALNGLLLGYISLYLFHVELKKRLPARTARNIIVLIVALCSFAIYLGRELRWNTWDVLVNPAGILLDISNRIIDPLHYPNMFVITGAFFVLLSTTYLALWQLADALNRPNQQ